MGLCAKQLHNLEMTALNEVVQRDYIWT